VAEDLMAATVAVVAIKVVDYTVAAAPATVDLTQVVAPVPMEP
jgi:hypothetical protein